MVRLVSGSGRDLALELSLGHRELDPRVLELLGRLCERDLKQLQILFCTKRSRLPGRSLGLGSSGSDLGFGGEVGSFEHQPESLGESLGDAGVSQIDRRLREFGIEPLDGNSPLSEFVLPGAIH